ncbi:MAG: DUF4346 domain-containing protein [DPANN group archaeon]|nr:DUF4346 domain-containing protein [DPANN group archaeon]
MDTIKHKPEWIKDKKIAQDFEIFDVPKWDDYKDFKTDMGCYVLIKVYRDRHEIGVAILNWFGRLDHAAYIGKELKKAEMCLALGSDYYQE